MLTRQQITDGLHYLNDSGLIKLGKITGQWYTIHCPFHSDGNEKKPSCGCSLEGRSAGGIQYNPGHFNCFACGASYSFSNGIKEILKIKGAKIEDHTFLQQYLDQSLPVDEDSLIPGDLVGAVTMKFMANDVRTRLNLSSIAYVPESELATYRYVVPYMYQRRLTDAIIEKYDVGYDANFIPPGRKKPMPCITFPVRDIMGRTLFICRRSIEGKFFNYPEGVIKPVYGVYELPKNCKSVIVCESIFNALTAVSYGYNAVALLGTGDPHQIDQLSKLGVSEYILCLDNDYAGKKGVAKLKKALSKSGLVWVMTVPEGKDANDLEKSEFDECYLSKE